MNDQRTGRFIKGTHWRPRKPYWDAAWLKTEYVDKHRSAAEIGQPFGTKKNGILFWLARHGIKRRTMTETRAVKAWASVGEANGMFGATGRANPNWKGGRTPERQSAYASARWKRVARLVLRRDKTCRRCGVRGGHVHHVSSFQNAAVRFDPANLVLLCQACHRWVHSRANKRRLFLIHKEVRQNGG